MHDRGAAESWIRAHVQPAAEITMERERPWSTVLRVPVAGGTAWFKACSPVQGFEPRLAAKLSERWPDRVGEVIAHDEPRAWLLLVDAGTALRALGNPPELWLQVLALYAELQRGEAACAADHIAHGVPPLPVSDLPGRYAGLLGGDLPLEPGEITRLREFAPRFELLWGDCSISHPFFSVLATFRFLQEHYGLEPGDPWFHRLRDAYLEPWGAGLLKEALDLAIRIGRFAHVIAWERQRDFLPSGSRLQPDRATFDAWFAQVLRRAISVI